MNFLFLHVYKRNKDLAMEIAEKVPVEIKDFIEKYDLSFYQKK